MLVGDRMEIYGPIWISNDSAKTWRLKLTLLPYGQFPKVVNRFSAVTDVRDVTMWSSSARIAQSRFTRERHADYDSAQLHRKHRKNRSFSSTRIATRSSAAEFPPELGHVVGAGHYYREQ
jgi:hypothetical protein